MLIDSSLLTESPYFQTFIRKRYGTMHPFCTTKGTVEYGVYFFRTQLRQNKTRSREKIETE